MLKAIELPQTFSYLYCANFKDMTKIQEKPVTPTAYISREEKNGITRDYLKSIFDYKDGALYWKPNKYNNHRHHIAGTFDKSDNYWKVFVKRSSYRRARLIFLWHNGYLSTIVDHENRVTTDDRIENLRPATLSQNNANRTKRCDAKSSKYIGVIFLGKKVRWIAKAGKDNKVYRSKLFLNQEDAALAYNKMAVKLHGEFASLNIISI